MTNTSIERRALYYLLRINWLNNPSLPVEAWQVADYRVMSSTELFEKLQSFDIYLDQTHFLIYADECDSPEDLTDSLIGDQQLTPAIEDQLYLIIFELWRQLMPDKPSLSIICHELDHLIYLYDQQQLKDNALLQMTLVNFAKILEENVDQGIPQHQVVQLVSDYCGNDIETFLYDFISEQIESGNESDAQELLDEFNPYLKENKWFKLLRLRLFGHQYTQISHKIIEQILEDDQEDKDLDFNLEFLAVLAELSENHVFYTVAKQTFDLIKTSEHLLDFIGIMQDFYHLHKKTSADKIFNSLLKIYENLPLNYQVDLHSSHLDPLIQLIEKNH